jgi:hypothetical protein
VKTGHELEDLSGIAVERQWGTVAHAIEFADRTVTAVFASGNEIGAALGSSLVIAELRRPRLVQSPLDLDLATQQTLIADLVQRIDPAPDDAPVVCIMDTGVHRHSLLSSSLSTADIHHVITDDGVDRHGHGTMQAGLALLGSLEDALTAPGRIALAHRLESVKIVPANEEAQNAPETYGAVTISGTVTPEVARPDRRRVHCFANSDVDAPSDGRPTSWSAAIDALAFGTDVSASPGRFELLSAPNPERARLFVVAAGNILDFPDAPYLDTCDLSPIEDPAQAWNALAVGAYTDLVDLPTDRSFYGHRPLAPRGDLSPFSRTSVAFGDAWPIKPDILMEGGNVLVSDSGSRQWPPAVCLTTTCKDEEQGDPLIETNMTSAATAQAARLAAVAAARYPSLWPETLRALLVQAAEWTPSMRTAVDAETLLSRRLRLIRRYGFGVPTLERVLASARNDATLLVQTTINPLERNGSALRMREMHLHALPWPRDLLLDMPEMTVRLKVTLSYFVEPNPSSRGWRGRFAYPSHGLRFDLRRPTETEQEFRSRLNDLARAEEAGTTTAAAGVRWYVGTRQRNHGSLHADIWTGTAAELAESNLIGVYPVGGWWKANNRRDRADVGVRYALAVSLSTPAVGIDLYTPIAAQLTIPIAIAA